MATRYRHAVRKGQGGYYVTQGPKNAFVVKAGPFRTRSAAWDWLNDHPEAYSVQDNPVSNTTMYVIGGVAVLGVAGLIYYFTRPKTLTQGGVGGLPENATDTNRVLHASLR